MTSDELRVTREELTPALRRWVKKLEAGDPSRPRRVWSKAERGLTWRPALFNPEGAYVQRVRMDTAIKLQELGYLKRREEE